MSVLRLVDVRFVVRDVHVPCQVEEAQEHHAMVLGIRMSMFEAKPVEPIPVAGAKVGMIAARSPHPSARSLERSPQGLRQEWQSSVSVL